MSDRRVAIACQGGGSHTAFTAGVLREMLLDWPDDAELVGISGTSGGAFNALAVWYGVVTGDRAKAADLLDGLWEDLAASGPLDRTANAWVKTYSRLESMGAPVPRLSPYQLAGDKYGKDRIRTVLKRHINFDAIPDLCERGVPKLVVGTVDVEAGVFETFTDEDVTPEAVLASAAVPNLFEAVEMNGHGHWDGLFSQNPPINDLFRVDDDRKPTELWVIQINPQEIDEVPTTVEEIADRRNELAGNISLNQELRFVERVNDWIDAGHLDDGEFTTCAISRIEMGRQYASSSKLDRSPSFIDELRELGRERGRAFLDGEL